VSERDRLRAVRIGENEALFRSVNEQVRGISDAWAVRDDTIRVVCECGTASCVEQIQLHLAEYEQIRADGARFVIRPGHEYGEVEEVVGRTDRYWTVRKDPGLPQQLAEATDPRDP
jgi:hypothetical protein